MKIEEEDKISETRNSMKLSMYDTFSFISGCHQRDKSRKDSDFELPSNEDIENLYNIFNVQSKAYTKTPVSTFEEEEEEEEMISIATIEFKVKQ